MKEPCDDIFSLGLGSGPQPPPAAESDEEDDGLLDDQHGVISRDGRRSRRASTSILSMFGV